jgi:serine/threonine-protein kinase
VAVAAGTPASAGFTLFPSAKPSAEPDPGVVTLTPLDTAAPAQPPEPKPAADRPRRTAGPISTPIAAAAAPLQQCGVAPANTPPAPSAVAAGSDEGFLNINSIPAATCFLDGKAIGSTPMMRVSVHAGLHTVKFVNADRGIAKSVTVKVDAGETKPAITRLE